MATFKFGRYIDIHWNGYDIQGPADTVFSIPDQLYEEFDADIAPVEPTLQWIDTNEFLTLSNSVSASTLSATFPIALSTSTSGKTISFSSSTNPNGYLLAADGSGGVIFTPASTSGLTSVVGVSPISTAVSGGTVSVSLNASYQTAGTYVTSVIGTSPVSASGTTAITVSIEQTTLSVADSSTAATLRTYVKNSSGSTITKGQVVYITGADGTNALIGLASNTSDAASSKTLGIAANTMTNNAFGYVIENGQLSNIDTSAATAGSAVWLGSTPGSYQFTVPDEPNHAVYLGVVTKANVSTGEILVKVQNGYELDELHDVSAGSPSDLDILQYKSSSSLWTKASIANAGIAASVHTHDYQVSGNYQTAGTYVNAVIGTSPASVSTASGTATVSISSGTATSGSVLTANGSGGVSFTALSSAATAFYVNGSGSVSGSSITSAQNGPYLLTNVNSRYIRVNQSTSSDTVTAQATIFINQKSSMTASLPIGWTWTSIDVGTTTAQANNIKYKNSAFYVLYNNGNISRSTDGSTFTVQISAATQALNDVEFGGSTLVACGNSGLIISSSNGTSWTQRTSNASTDNLGGVAYGASTFAAVGNNGRLVTSSDGTTWTSRTSGFGASNITDVLFGASLFVAYSINAIRTSPDGITWTVRTVPATISGNLNRGTFENSLFVIGSNSGEIITSSDGITWTEVTSPNGSSVRGIEYLGSSRWIMTGQNGTVYYSFDNASTWETLLTINNAQQAVTALDDMNLSFGNNRLFAVNASNTNSASVYSTTTEPFSFAFIGMTSVTA